MTTINSDNIDENAEEQRPRQQSLGGVLRREGNWRCLLLSALLAGCIGAAIWCRLAQVQKVVINFSVYPIKRTRQMSPCDDGYIYIPVAFMGLLYLVYLVECYHCTARLQLAHRVDVNAVVDRVRAMRLAKPKVWWKAVCYHYVRRKRQVTRYRNGDSYTTTQVYYERVNTHSASATFVHAYCGYKDVSRNLILDSRGPITKIRFSKGFAFSNIEAASEFEDQRSRFFADHERFGDYMEMREGLDLVGVSSFKEYMVAYRDSDSMPWYSSHVLFWVMSCLLLSWPLRILIECNTSYVHYTITKIFGVNYDMEATRRQELEQSMTRYPVLMQPTTVSPRRTLPEVIHTTQSAIIVNQNVGPSTVASQPINILALARSRNNLDQGAAMSHTSTIDSLELFATIRENCTLVPSYSEALLLSSMNNDTTPSANDNQTDPEDVQIVVLNAGANCRNSLNRNTYSRRSLEQNQRIVPSTSNVDNISQLTRENIETLNYQSAIIGPNITPTRKRLRIAEEYNVTDSSVNCSSLFDTDDSISESSNKSPLRILVTQSSYNLKANNASIDKNTGSHYKAQNRKSWAGFLSKPINNSRGHCSARVRPIPLLNCRKNSLTDSLIKQTNEPQDAANSVLIQSEDLMPMSQIESIDRNLSAQEDNERSSGFYFASPLLGICPDDPFGGRRQTTPTEDPPPYEVAVNMPPFRRITRSVTDRGELFGQSRAFINDTLLNRRSCVDNIVSGADAVRLLEGSSNRENATDMETNL